MIPPGRLAATLGEGCGSPDGKKYSPSESLDWVADLGGVNDIAQSDGIAVDGSGNVYTTGEFQGTNINFDPNSGSHHLSSSHGGTDQNAFVLKLNASGDYVFGVDLGAGGQTVGYAIAVDGADNIYTTGFLNGTNLNFNPNGGSNLLSSSGTDTAYVSKLNSAGGYSYALEVGSGGYSKGLGITLDAIGDVYTTGYFSGGNVNFDPNSNNHQLFSSHSGGDYNAFVSKLSPSGQYILGVDIGFGGNAHGGDIAIDGAGNIYSTGYFSGSNLNFDPNSNAHPLSSSHGGTDENGYVSKLSASGQYDLAVDLGSGGIVESDGIALDGSGNIYTTGVLQGVGLNFDPNSGSHQLSSTSGGNDENAYVSILNSSGQFTFAAVLGAGASTATGSGITVDSANNIYVTGYFIGPQANFNPLGALDLSSANNSDSFFLAKFTQPVYRSLYAAEAYNYTYFAYIYAYDAYATGEGSYAAFVDEYDADYYAQYASMYATAGDAANTESNAYYAYYYGYLGQYYAYQDYAVSGGASIYSYYAYYDGYFGQYYSYYTAVGQ